MTAVKILRTVDMAAELRPSSPPPRVDRPRYPSAKVVEVARWWRSRDGAGLSLRPNGSVFRRTSWGEQWCFAWAARDIDIDKARLMAAQWLGCRPKLCERIDRQLLPRYRSPEIDTRPSVRSPPEYQAILEAREKAHTERVAADLERLGKSGGG